MAQDQARIFKKIFDSTKNALRVTGIGGSFSSQITWNTGLGAITHVLGPSDESLKITSGVNQIAILNGLGTGHLHLGTAGDPNAIEIEDTAGGVTINGALTVTPMIVSVGGDQVIYNPNNAPTPFTGTLIVGDGGGSLSHGSGVEGYSNTVVGVLAGSSLTSAARNTLVGESAGTAINTGNLNVVIGWKAGSSITSGASNVIIGSEAGLANVLGTSNTAIGRQTLYANIGGSNNAALGSLAGRYHDDGSTALTSPEDSIYIGYSAMGKDNSDSYSIVIGRSAVGKGANTTVIGTSGTTTDCYLYGEQLFMEDDQVIYNPQATFTGTLVVGDGGGSLSYSAGTDGFYNAVMGVGAGAGLTDGESNTLVGYNSGDSITTGSDCVVLGDSADTAAATDTNAVVIGSAAVGLGSNTVVLGTSGTTTDTYLYGILHPDAVIRLKQASASSSSNVLTLDFSAASTYTVTLTENVTTLTVTNAAAGDKVMILFTQDVGGTHTVAFPGGWIWPAGAVPTITAAGGSKDCVTVYYDGTNYWADFSQNFS
jgi:hypothetical protein